MADTRVFAVASGKGGVGKTTSAVNLGTAFAETGRSVVVVDLDLGMANLADVLAVETADATLHDVLSGDAEVGDALASAQGGFDVMTGSPDIEAFGKADPSGLREVVAALRARYDVVVLDTGGGLSHDTTLPLGLADGVVLVTTPDDAAVRNTAKTREFVDRLGGTVEGLLVTRIGGPADTGDDPAGDLAVPLLGSVPEDSAIPRSAAAGEPLVATDRDSPAAQSYREIAYAMLDEPLPRDWAGDDGRATGPAQVVGADGQAVEATETANAAPPEPEERPPEPASENAEAGDLAAAIEAAESDPDAGSPIAGGDRGVDGDSPIEEAETAAEGDERSERSLLSKLTGGLFG
ncbi:MAG: P-loop NTPase [Halobacterium sp.]